MVETDTCSDDGNLDSTCLPFRAGLDKPLALVTSRDAWGKIHFWCDRVQLGSLAESTSLVAVGGMAF